MQYLNRHKVDIALLQETHLPRSDVTTFATSWGQHRYFANYSSYARGTAILIHKRLPFHLRYLCNDPAGRYMIVAGVLLDHALTLVCVYAPNTDDPCFFQDLYAQLHKISDTPILMGGDFNMLLNTSIDSSSISSSTKPKSLPILTDICDSYALKDAWRTHFPHDAGYTHYSGYHDTWTRIDHWWLSSPSYTWLRSMAVLPRTLSDHSPLLLQLAIPLPEGYERQWRFPSRALSDDAFHAEIRDAIEEYFRLNTDTVDTWATLWEAFKAFIRGVCISKRGGILRSLQAELRSLETALAGVDTQLLTDPDPALLKRRHALLLEFREVAERESSFLGKYHTARKYGEGERPGRTLAQLLKPPYSKAYITELQADGSQTLTTTESIREAFLSYYSTLYSTSADPNLANQEAYLSEIALVYLEKNMQEFLAEPFTAEEVISAIEAINGSTAPGLDGFTGDFYKSFKDLLAPKLVEMYAESLEQNRLPPTLREAVIVLLPKPGKDATQCTSYRPLSLLNLDYK